MNAALKLLKDIKSVEVQHPHFVDQHQHLSTRIRLAQAGLTPKIEWVMGPSRVGKSMLINVLSRENPSTREGGVLKLPIVVAKVPEQVSPQHLPGSVLQGMGMPVPRGNVGAVRQQMLHQLKRAGTHTLLFEEASHIVDTGTKIPPRAAADFFKTLADEGIFTVLFGVPRLSRLRANEQLRLRSAAPRNFRPYDCRSQEEQRFFAGCIVKYLDMFKAAGWPIAMTREVMFAQCYLMTGGLVGVLAAFMQTLAEQRLNDGPRTLSWEDCQRAADQVEPAGDPRWLAFHETSVGMTHLIRAHAHVFEINEMTLPAVGPGAEGTACH